MFLLGDHQSLQVGAVDHSLVDLELGKGVVDLAGGELVAKGHQGVSAVDKLYEEFLEPKIQFVMFHFVFCSPECLRVNLAVDLEGLEGLQDDVIVVGASGHLAGEQGDHLGEVHRAVHLVQHGLQAREG